MSEYVVGRSPVIEYLQHHARCIEKIWIAEGNNHSRIRYIITRAQQAGVPVRRCSRRELDRMESSVPHQDVIALINLNRYSNLPSILAKLQSEKREALLIILDGVQDPRNLGAILRTADAANADGVIIPKNNAVGITPAVHKASAGASEHVPIIKVQNIGQTIDRIKKAGIWVVGSDEAATCSYTDANFSVPLCIVLGSEGKGIRRLVEQKCDYLVSLPMFGQIESLNVSVAAGVLLYEVLRQRS